ncbi:hypothetical protein ABTY98_18050 [Streptomyces sp. NPDC096040]|uniref:hypothetical protein n=1 Tax=Streptomyces sp. NPDC096040 TaxID=3155541 RepID=UPI00331D2C99
MNTTTARLSRHREHPVADRQANTPDGSDSPRGADRRHLLTARGLIAGATASTLALLGLLTGGTAQAATATQSAPAVSAPSQFHGVNWADPNDNFITGPNVPVGLSTSDDYATVYAKSTAILKGFQSVGVTVARITRDRFDRRLMYVRALLRGPPTRLRQARTACGPELRRSPEST